MSATFDRYIGQAGEIQVEYLGPLAYSVRTLRELEGFRTSWEARGDASQ